MEIVDSSGEEPGPRVVYLGVGVSCFFKDPAFLLCGRQERVAPGVTAYVGPCVPCPPREVLAMVLSQVSIPFPFL